MLTMVKMAYTSPLRIISKTSDKTFLYRKKGTNNDTLSKMLQSDQVRRLLNQPNIIIKTTPVVLTLNKQNTLMEPKKITFVNKTNGMNAALNNVKPSDLSIVPVRIPEEKEDDHLLPSKVEDKKSEIILLPIKRKVCGHYEPCESLICDVIVQQYVDKDGTSPILAMSIEEDEINAPVAKHCSNKDCDALSIDHNRCRRASIKLYRCDKSDLCDICAVSLGNSRIYHKGCLRIDEYMHNNVNQADLMKERMRERELQILESLKTKRKDYSDPVKAMETLRKNEELIIIPKMMPSQQPIITITSVPTIQSASNLSSVQPIKIDSKSISTNILGGMSFAISPQNAKIPGAVRSMENKTQSIGQVNLLKPQQKAYVTSGLSARGIPTRGIPAPVVISAPTIIPAPPVIPSTVISTPTPTITTSTPTSVPMGVTFPVMTSQNKFVRLTTSSKTNATVQPLTGWVMSPASDSSRNSTNIPIQIKPLLTPIRVMPITKLITAPSLLHRTQGVPKFCIMTIQNPTSTQQPLAVTVNAGDCNVAGADNAASASTAASAGNAASASTATSAGNAVSAGNVANASIVIAQKNVVKNVEPLKIPIKNIVGSFRLQNNSSQSWPLKKKRKLFHCPYCSKYFTTDWYYKAHVAKHRGMKSINCDVCSKSFSSSYHKRKHMNTQHKKFICEKCVYSCDSLAILRNHIQTWHPSTLSYEANINSRKRDLSCDNEIKHMTMHELLSAPVSSNGKNMKKIKWNVPDSSNEIEEVTINGETTQSNDEPHESAYVDEYDDKDKESLTINGDDNTKTNEFTFVSVEENIDLENFEQETS